SLKQYATKLKNKIREIEENSKKIGVLNARVTALREPMLIGVVCLVILVHIFILKGHLASVMISLLFFYRALAALMNLQNRYNSFLAVSGSLDNITKFEQELREGAEKEGTKEFEKLNNAIEVQNVDFGYDEPNGIIKQLHLKIN